MTVLTAFILAFIFGFLLVFLLDYIGTRREIKKQEFIDRMCEPLRGFRDD
ncbi:hypothetical protein ACU4I5_05740 [Ensifer adhaerens]